MRKNNSSTIAALLKTCGHRHIHSNCASTLFSRAEGSCHAKELDANVAQTHWGRQEAESEVG